MSVFFGQSKHDLVIEERVNLLRERPTEMKGLRYPQIIEAGTESLSDTQRKLKHLLKNLKRSGGLPIMDGSVQKTLSVEVNYYKADGDVELPCFLL